MSLGGLRLVLAGEPLFPHPTIEAERVIGIADMNRDGRPDIVLGDYQWLVLLADARGGHRPVQGAIASYPESGAIADFNLDGNPDVATTTYVFLGAGDGTLNIPIDIEDPWSSGRVVASDFDGDGRPDLVDSRTSSLGLRRGLGNGRFTARQVVATGTAYEVLVKARLNPDGFDDLLAAAPDLKAVYPYLGRGDGTFEALAPISLDRSFSFIDAVQADTGSPVDLVIGYACGTTCSGAGGVEIWTGAGDGSFTRAGSWLPGELIRGAAIADFTADGFPDLAVVESTRMLTILPGTPAGVDRFGDPIRQLVGLDLSRITAALLDDNPGVDLLATGQNRMVMLRDLAQQEPLPLDVSGTRRATAVAAGDLNNDGKQDLAFLDAQSTNSLLHLALSGPARSFSVQPHVELGFAASRIAVGDLHSDGILDLFVSASTSSFRLLRGRGDGTFFTAQTLSIPALSWDEVSAQDVDGDGRNDLLISAPFGNQAVAIVFYSRPDGTLSAPTSMVIGGTNARMLLVDFNGDHRFDVVTPRPNPSHFLGWSGLELRLQTSLGVFGSPSLVLSTQSTTTSPEFTSLDWDGDGIPDLAALAPEGMRLLRGDGAGGFGAPVAPSYPYGGVGLPVAGDFDADTRTDIAFKHGPDVRILPGAGPGSFGEAQAHAGFMSDHLIAGDFDGDSAPDFAIRRGAQLFVLFNQVLNADEDGDGVPDVTDSCVDPDQDGAGLPDYPASDCPVDLCPGVPNPTQADIDGDLVGDACDPCPGVSDPGQVDFDGDGVGDACDPCVDPDGDGFDEGPERTGVVCGRDNCPGLASHDQADADADGRGDACDGCAADPLDDADRDALCADHDNCALVANFEQTDADADGAGDACDSCPGIPNADQADTDQDGEGDACEGRSADRLFPSPGWSMVASSENFVSTVDVAVGDYDGDGRTDLVLPGYEGEPQPYSGNRLQLWHGLADGRFIRTATLDLDVQEVRALAGGDFDGDGHRDVAWVGYGGSVRVLPGRGNGTFAADYAVALPYLSYPRAFLGRDVNNDGRDDLLVLDQGSFRSFLVSLSRPGRRFEPFESYPLGFSPMDMAVLDFNGDQLLDVAVIQSCSDSACQQAGEVRLFAGAGDGRFDPGSIIAIDGQPRALTAGDFDHDGRDDLAVAAECAPSPCQALPAVSIVSSSGGAYSTQVVAIGTYLYPGALVAVDLDRDGDLDLALAGSGEVRILEGDGRGGFEYDPDVDRAAAGEGTVRLVAGDFDRDGLDDLIELNLGGPNFFLLLGHGDRTLGRAVQPAPASYVSDAIVADFDRDGVPDLVSGTWEQNGLIWFQRGLGEGRFAEGTSIPAYARYGPVRLAAADFNEDGKLDLVAAGNGVPDGDPVFLLLGRGDGTFAWSYASASGNYYEITDLVAHDLDGDGHQDLLVTDAYSGQAQIYFGDGSGDLGRILSPFQTIQTTGGTSWADVGDLDGDGDPDLVIASSGFSYLDPPGTLGEVHVHLNAGDGTFDPGPLLQAGTRPSSLALGDLDGDGRPDLVVTNKNSHDISVFAGRGDGAFGAQVRYPAGRQPVGVVIDDLNADGRLDVAVANSGSGDVSTRLGIGDGTLGPESRHLSGSYTFGLRIGYVDRDLRPDLVVPVRRGTALLTNLGPPGDHDGDGISDDQDPCIDPDADGSRDPRTVGICPVDNCPSVANPDQANRDGDPVGDACDVCPGSAQDDADDDGACDDVDVCLGMFTATQADADGDGRGDACDNCPAAPNPDQADGNGDGAGNACQPFVRIARVREDGGHELEVEAIARDPQGTSLGGTIVLTRRVETAVTIPNILPAFDCATTWKPDPNVAGAVAYYSEGNVVGLVDVAALGTCTNEDGHYQFAEGDCESSPEYYYFSDYVDFRSDKPVICLQIDWSPSRRFNLFVDRFDGVAVHFRFEARQDLTIPIEGGLPDRVSMPGLQAGGTHALTLTVSDGTTPAVSDTREFTYQGEQDLVFVVPSGDVDGDGVDDAGDACIDTDGDGARDPGYPGSCAPDACPHYWNLDQRDGDGDGIGDVCDNCPLLAGAEQSDIDGDGRGDACDACPTDPAGDPDQDGVCRDTDNCGAAVNPDQVDADHDGLGDACDNCPGAPNPTQEDVDADFIGDACDPCEDLDRDGRGTAASGSAACAPDNCPVQFNPGQEDADGDGSGDACDPCPADALDDADQDGICGDLDQCPGLVSGNNRDRDGDQFGDRCDNCPVAFNPDQANLDHNRYGDACEPLAPGAVFAYPIFDLGENVERIVAADIDADGRRDVIAFSPGADHVMTLPGTGAGTFQPSAPLLTRAGMTAMATGDMDGDGRSDLVIAGGSYPYSIFVKYGLTSGGYGSPVALAATTYPAVRLVLADLDHDGRTDVVAGADYGVEVLVQSSTGSLLRSESLLVGQNPLALAVVDMNGDGDVDIVTTSAGDSSGGGEIRVAAGRGDGSFNAGLVTTLPRGLIGSTVADLDGDRHPDAVVADSAGVRILRNVGRGRFSVAGGFFSVGAPIRSIAAGDFNGDGRFDIAIGHSTSSSTFTGGVKLYRGTGGFGFAAVANPLTGRAAHGLAVDDFNADGIDDLAIRLARPNTFEPSGVQLLLGTPDGALPISPLLAASGGAFVFAARLNGDDIVDLVGGTIGSVVSYLGTGEATFAAGQPTTGVSGPTVAVADFTNDGLDDVLTVTGSISVSQFIALLSAGDGTFPQRVTSNFTGYPSGYATVVATGEMNGDGRLDVVIGTSIPSVDVYHGDGTGRLDFAGRVAAPSQPLGMDLRDLDGDGRAEIAVSFANEDTVRIHRRNHDGTIDTGTSIATGDAPIGVAFGQFDGMGRIDLAVAERGSGTVSVWTGLPDGSFGPPRSVPTKRPYNLKAADLEGDGTDDLVVSSDNTGFRVVETSPDGSLTQSVYYDYIGSYDIAVADLDQDRDLDVVTSSTPMRLFLNHGTSRDGDRDGVFDDLDSCTDIDGDGFGDPGYPANTCQPDNCPGTANAAQADADADGRGDACDNCPDAVNADQIDQDQDGQGDACDTCTDRDGDGYGDPGHPTDTCPTDNCVVNGNSDQADADSDGLGNACDLCTDRDADGRGDPGFPVNTCALDNCPAVANPGWFDFDADGIGDACDTCTDTDADGFGNSGQPPNTCPTDNCPAVANPQQTDFDVDGSGDACDTCTDRDRDGLGDPGFPVNLCLTDNCPAVPNPGNADEDHDGLGDACDSCTDADRDGLGDPGHPGDLCARDNCPATPNSSQADRDLDGVGDACDTCTDTDGDGRGDPDVAANQCPRDNCPAVPNPDQSDVDQDAVGDVCDPCPGDRANDADRDGLCGEVDNCPAMPNPDQQNRDGDPFGDTCDNCPVVANPDQTDQDADGHGESCDVCPRMADPSQGDADLDGHGDACDTCPTVSDPDQADGDRDGSGDACQPLLRLDSLTSDGHGHLLARGRAIDPQGEPLQGRIGVIGFGGAPIAMRDVLATFDCADAFLPDGVPGEGIGFSFDGLEAPYLFDMDNTIGCLDGLPDFVVAPGSCAQPLAPFDTYIALNDPYAPPVDVCVRRFPGTDGGMDIHVLGMEAGVLLIRAGAPTRLIDVPFDRDLPREVTLADLQPNAEYVLAIDATDGNTHPLHVEASFTYSGESTLLLQFGGAAPQPAIASTPPIECAGPSGSPVTLDGRASLDPDSSPGTADDIAAYDWYVDFGGPDERHLANGAVIEALLPVGEHSISLKVEDRAGLTGVATTTVEVRDTAGPVLTCPTPGLDSGSTAECGGPAGAPVSLSVTAFDQCSGTASIVNDRNAGGSDASDTYPLGTTQVEFVATDAVGNEVRCSVPVTVVDTLPPLIDCPAAAPAAECTGAGGAYVTVSATAHDLCGGSVTLANDRTPGGSDASGAYPLGSTNVVFGADDGRGNSATCTTAVSVVDTQPPTLSVFTDPGSLWPPNHEMVPVNVQFAAHDACGAGVRVELVSVTSSEPDDAPGGEDGQTTADIQQAEVGSADATVDLRAERGGKGGGRTYTLNYRAIDLVGHATAAVGLVTVPHDQGQGPEPLQQRVERAGPGSELRLYWPAVPGATSYDVIRGDLAAWRAADGVLRLGTVEVLARGTTATSVTEPAGAPAPPVGGAWFYLIQQTTDRGAVGYGTESAPWPRVPDACTGGCPGTPGTGTAAAGGATGSTGTRKR